MTNISPKSACLLGLALIIGTVTHLSYAEAEEVKTKPAGFTQPLIGKKLIQIGQDAPNTAYVRRHIREMEKSGFDGLAIVPTVKIGGKTGSMMWGSWFSPQKWEYSNFQHVVDDMKAAAPKRLTDNFMWIVRNVLDMKYDDGTMAGLKQPDWFADDFQITIDNLALAARISKDAGLKGIAFDFEQYGGGVYSTWRYPFNYGLATTEMDRPFDECQAQVRLRGKQIMQAISKEYPDITIMVLPAGYEVAEITANLSKQYNPKLEGLAASQYSLYPAFLDGLIEGAGPKVRLLNCNEDSYGYTIDSQFQVGRKNIEGAAQRLSTLPASARRKMGIAFGIWLDHRGWNQQAPFYANHFTPGEFQHALNSAMRNSDGYAWVWCEHSIFWPNSGGLRNGPGTVPIQYMTAIANSKKAQPNQFRRDNRGAATEPLPESATLKADYSDENTFGPLATEYEYVLDLPRKWQFLADDLDVGIGQYQRVDWDTSKWASIEIGDYYEKRGYQFNGMAWYRCEIEIPKVLEGKPVYLHFGGIAGGSHLYVNGQWLEPSNVFPNGVQAWDITPKARYGQKNIILLQIHNPAGPGGIYKSVKLAVKRN